MPSNLIDIKNISKDTFFNKTIYSDELVYHYAFSGVDVEKELLNIDLASIKNAHNDVLALKPVNNTESRSVTHFYARHPKNRSQYNDLKLFCDNVHQHRVMITGKKVSSICHIGLGGSISGSRFIYQALTSWGKINELPCVFLSSHDENHISNQLKNIDISTTLFLIVSKSGTTFEISKIIDGIIYQYNLEKEPFYQNQCISVTLKGSPMDNDLFFKRFTFDIGIGGRFSVTSVVGLLSLGLSFGSDIIDPFLDAAYEMDQQSLIYNQTSIAFTSAVVNYIYRQKFKLYGLAYVPYGEAFVYLNQYITQMICESLGKNVTMSGDKITEINAPIVMHGHGPEAQHTFFQQLHQSSWVIPSEFIFTMPTHRNQKYLMQQIIGQMVCLANGQSSSRVNHQFDGNKPSTLLILNHQSIRSLGKFVSVFENRIMLESFLMNINAFDQPGVELGKTVINKMVQPLSEDDVLDNNTKLANDIYKAMV